MEKKKFEDPVGIEKLAREWGIENEYLDNWGKVHQTSLDTKAALLEAMGVGIGGGRKVLEGALRHRRRLAYGPLCNITLVVSRDSLPERFFFHLPPDRTEKRFSAVTLSLTYENGTREEFRYPSTDVQTVEAPESHSGPNGQWAVPFPSVQAIGYHSLHLSVTLEDGKVGQDIFLIVCPDKAYVPRSLEGSGRRAGISLSLYGVRSERNWGIGDFTDLKTIVDWVCDELHGNIIGLNPLHAGYNRRPYNISPYLPISKFYRNYIYLDVEGLPEYESSPAAGKTVNAPETQRELARLRKAEKVEYERVAALKREVLRTVFEDFLKDADKGIETATVRWEIFSDYVEKEGEPLDRFALFCALDEYMHEEDSNIWTWKQWPKAYRHPDNEAVSKFRQDHREDVLFHKYVQWQLDEQLSQVQQYARDHKMCIGMYHDLALAIDNFGADAWGYQECFYPRVRVGAPPDAFAQNGQDWGFAPPNMAAVAGKGYEFFAREIRKNCRLGGALRIDHVMRLFHLYCIPEGKRASEGAYVSQPYEDLLKILLLESVRNEVLIIGEDLGTVPDYIRNRLSEANIFSYRLLYFEKDKHQDFIDPMKYPDLALVAISTHDLPTLAGFWSCRDIQLREALEMFEDDKAVVVASQERLADKRKLLQLARAKGFHHSDDEGAECNELSGDIHNALVGLLAITPCKLLVLSQEDLFKDERQQNVPGTIEAYPNWSIKMKYTVEELKAHPDAIGYSRMFRSWIENSGRAG